MALHKHISSVSANEADSISLLVTCPSCDHEFEIGESIAARLRQEAETKLASWKTDFLRQLRERESEISDREAQLQEAETLQQKIVEDLVNRQLQERVTAEYPELVKRARETANAEAERRVIEKQTELDEALGKLGEFQDAQAELLKEQRTFKADRARFELDKQQAISDAIENHTATLKLGLDQEYAAKFQMQNLELERTKRQVEELNQKLKAKPSQELQGEAFEMDLESKLVSEFPMDDIKPIKKGQRGADLRQRVHSRIGESSGTILWELKQAENWSGEWIAKLKADQREARATVAIIVSHVTPAAIDSFGIVDGVWIVKPEFAICLAVAIREGLLQTSDARRAAEGVETKAGLVYQYLMSEEFKSRFGAIVETFVEMQRKLIKEKASASKNFSQREKQHETVLKACFGVLGDLQGIAGQDLKSLEEIEQKALPQGEGEEE